MKGKKLVKVIIPVAIIALVAVVLVMNFRTITNAINKATMEPDKYTQHVLEDNFNRNVSQLSKTYGNATKTDVNNISGEASVNLKLSKDALALIEENSDYDELDMFSDMTVKYEMSIKNDKAYVKASFFSGKTQIISGEVIFDKEEKMAYVRSDELNSKYMEIDLSDYISDEEMDEVFEMLSIYDALKENLPTQKQFESMLKRYFAAAVEQVGDVEMGSEKLEINGVSQKLTTLTIDVDEDLVRGMIVAMCEEMASDEVLEECMENTIEFIADTTDMDIRASEVYDEFTQYLDDIIEEADDISFGDAEVTLVLYVNNKGDIQAVNITAKDDSHTMDIVAGYVVSGFKFAGTVDINYEIEAGRSKTVENEMAFNATGTKIGNGINADCEYFISEDGDEEFNFQFKVKNLNLSGIYQGKLSGSVEIEVDKLLELLSDNGVEKFVIDQIEDNIGEHTIVYSFDISPNKQKVGLNIKKGSKSFASFETVVSIGKGKNISIPKNAVEISDQSDIEDYLSDCSLDKVIKNLKKVKAPEEAIEELEDIDL